MAELVLSALLPLLFEKLASTTLKTIATYKGVDVEIKNWQRSLKQIESVLTDASRKEIASDSVKQWLNDLQHLAYDIDDVLDDLATDAMHREFAQESEATISKVRKLIPSCCTSFSRNSRMNDKLESITARLKDLVEEKAALGLTVEGESCQKNINRRLQTSMVHASSIVGRQTEKEALLHRLLGHEQCDHNFSIVPIVGMGGVGKTTLARLLYDEEKVKDHFELKAWVCVSDEFDSFGISKVIFQSVTGVQKKFEDLNLLQVDLREHLREKRFLLVLDDVWSESYEDWETLVGPFHVCAPGSKIIMTTRKNQLLQQLGYDNLTHLQSLSHDDALSLFAQHALGVNEFDSHLLLKSHAEGIIKKCGCLPLALIALGRLLRTKKNDEEYWKEVLNSEIWRLQDGGGIVPALRLSYHDLPSHLKRLFAYCSLFPKDFLFKKEELVLLWMAEGFLYQSTPRNSTEERLGHDYFDELLSRSFFQHAPNNESLFLMHDLMNDLAASVAGDFFIRLDVNEMEKDIQKKPLEKYRHMSFFRENYVGYKKFEPLTRARSLRAFLATSIGKAESWDRFYLSSKILVDLLPELPLLRVLCLSDFCVSEVPNSIGTLRHLRYLNLSRTMIKHLPENVCNLYHLQTLILFSCHFLLKLPSSFLKLKNLRHLDISDTPLLDRMPLGIGELKSLQTLSKIIIGSGSRFEITKLKDLRNLSGKISIVGLENVRNATHAHEANFSQKNLSELEVAWGDEPYGSRNDILEKEVLNELKPRSEHLKKLEIVSYGGLEWPNWVGNPSFLHLNHVSVRDCKRCTSLPPLGQLPSLKELFIEGLYGVKVVGSELLGAGGVFPSLNVLRFKNMQGWERWSTNTRVVFPCLQHLHVEDCPNLVEVTLEMLPSLNVLEIEKCPILIEVSLALPSLNVLETSNCDSILLRRLVQIASSIAKLRIGSIIGLNDVVWRDVIECLGAVEELNISFCDEIRYLWESEAVASKFLVNLRNLRLFSCDNLVSLGEKEEEDNCRSSRLASLRALHVVVCKNMECCCCPDSIEDLTFLHCGSITTISLPTEGLKLKSLTITGCDKLLEREWGVQNINNARSMPTLENVWINDWPNLKSFIEPGYLVHLTSLWIENCESLESFPDHALPNLTSLKELRITDCLSMDDAFPRGFWPPNLCSLRIGKLKRPISDWGPQNFPVSLVELSLWGEDRMTSSSQFSHLLPSSLTRLGIYEFEKLESTSMGLQHLTSLKHLTFFNCPNMMNLPEVMLPSLLSLNIRFGCPNLTERYSKRGAYWPLISHIPLIDI